MANPLLERVLPADLADLSQIIDFKLKISDFERLREISKGELEAVSASGQPRDWGESPVEGKLEFGWLDTAREFAVANGQVRATMPVACQRCLEAFELVVDTPVRIRFVRSDDDREQDDYDTWEFDDRSILLQDVVEEAIVMALPLAPLHDSDTDCGRLAEKAPAAGPEMTTPFADLKSRMANKDN